MHAANERRGLIIGGSVGAHVLLTRAELAETSYRTYQGTKRCDNRAPGCRRLAACLGTHQLAGLCNLAGGSGRNGTLK